MFCESASHTAYKLVLIENLIPSFFFIRIYFIRISRLTFEKFSVYFKNKAEAEILKRIDIILCVETAVLMQCNFFNLRV